MATEKKTFKMPKSLGLCADRLFQLKELRLEAQKIVESYEAEESQLKEHIIETLPQSDASGVAGKVARVTIEIKDVPQVANWDEFYKYIVKTKSFDMLQRRLTDTAIRARWEDGKTIPGVEHFKLKKISLNKV